MSAITLEIVPTKRGRPTKPLPARIVQIDNQALSALSSTNFSRAPIIPCSPEEKPAKIIKEERRVDPFATAEDVNQIVEHLFCTCQWREYMLIVVGVNTGLRYSDLSQLRFCDLMDDDGYFKKEIILSEVKTRRKQRDSDGNIEYEEAIKNRKIAINEAVRQAVSIFLVHNPRRSCDLLFESQSNNKSLYNKVSKPLCNSSFGDIIQKAAREAGVTGHFNTHTLRKTFGCNFMRQHRDDPEALHKLQLIFGHSSAKITMRYIGITADMIRDAYLSLDLGNLKTIAKQNSVSQISQAV